MPEDPPGVQGVPSELDRISKGSEKCYYCEQSVRLLKTDMNCCETIDMRKFEIFVFRRAAVKLRCGIITER